MFLITGFGASGTKYTSEIFKSLGYKVEHEKMGKDGVVSWKHLPQHRKFDSVLYQYRHPLKVIRSGITGRIKNWKWMASHFDYAPKINPNENRLYWTMWLYYHWTSWAGIVCDIAYPIEDFENQYQYIFDYLNLPIPDRLPNIPKNFNTHSKRDLYRDITWNDLLEEDYELANRILEVADYLEYEI